MARKLTEDGRTIYLSHNDFENLEDFPPLKLADYDLCAVMDGELSTRRPIQPRAYQASEVMLGIPFSYSADIWDLGLLVLYLLQGRDLFSGSGVNKEKYSTQQHMARIVHAIGHPPKSLLEREKKWRSVPYSMVVTKDDGSWCPTPCHYYDGPFFGDDGALLSRDIDQEKHQPRLEDFITVLEGEDKALFIDLIGQMLQWVPEERKTAMQLLEHPWLKLRDD